MARVRTKRRNISLDMTAMCDMAFLLLTFFMLATKFKPEENVTVNMPSSIAQQKIEETDIITISVDKSGAVFFGMGAERDRRILLDKISSEYKVDFSDEEKHRFSLLPSIGVPVSGLKSVINGSKAERKSIEKGIPVDSVKNELKDWVYLARLTNRKAKIAIKGDMETGYPVVEKIIATLQEQNINKFYLVTSLEATDKK